jgi:citrate lyase subunit beta/citryl-CoA lyase
MNTDVARSLLFVPGDRPERFDKAVAGGADLVLCDLEDAVAPPNKDQARAAVAGFLGHHPAAVRINGVDSPWHEDDLDAVIAAAGLRAVVLPKADSLAALRATTARLPAGVALYALLESARGVRDADQIAEMPGVGRLLFGNIDFGLDAGVTAEDPLESELLYARSRIVVASRAAGLPPPVDGVTTDLYDPVVTRDAARRARNLGFGGKLCLHPKQVSVVNTAFSPDAEELRWARRVLEATADSGGAAIRVDGEMIDAPRVELARRLLAASKGVISDQA